jgi:hypothetical protein
MSFYLHYLNSKASEVCNIAKTSSEKKCVPLGSVYFPNQVMLSFYKDIRLEKITKAMEIPRHDRLDQEISKV